VNADTIANIVTVCVGIVVFFVTHRYFQRIIARKDALRIAQRLLEGCKVTAASSWKWSERDRCFMIPDYYYDNIIALRRIAPANPGQPGELRCDVAVRRAGVESHARASYYDDGKGDQWVSAISQEVAWHDGHPDDKSAAVSSTT